MQGYTLCTVPVHSPLWDRLYRRSVWITPQQYRLIAKVQGGWVGNQRTLAAALGYSLGGLNESIDSLARLGILGKLTRVGRLGWTRLKIQKGVHALRNALGELNVRTVVRAYSSFASLTQSTHRTFSESNPLREEKGLDPPSVGTLGPTFREMARRFGWQG